MSPPEFTSGLSFLAIEDFGTTGLAGPTDQFADTDDADDDDFYYFWRNVGRTGKGEGTRGTWGLGKTVFPASSRINAFLGITSTENDPKSHLLGRCDLKSHRVSGKQYEPYGYYADWRDGKPMPISDDYLVQEISGLFHLKRTVGEPGLSIVIPHVVDEFDVDMLRAEVIENYFLPILNGELVIEVQENYLTPPETVMNRTFLLTQLDDPQFRRSHPELADTIQLAFHASRGGADMNAIVMQPFTGSSSDWDNAEWLGDGIDSLRNKAFNGEIFTVQVQCRINQRGRRSPSISTCMLYGKPVSYRTRRRSYFSRQGVNVERACQRNPDGYVFLVAPSSGALSDMLASAENPAHTEFMGTDAIKQRYERGTMQTIRFLQTAPQGIAKVLEVEDDEPDQGLFSDVFWRPVTPKANQSNRRRRNRRPIHTAEAQSDTPTVTVEKREPAFNMVKVESGFRVSDNPNRNWQIDELEFISISAGYEGVRGDPIKQHSHFDFDFTKPRQSGILIKNEGCEVNVIAANKIRLIDLEQNFAFVTEGFDVKRDLLIRATPRRTRR